MKYYYLATLSILLSLGCHAQQTPFHRGVNLSNWFERSSIQQVHATRYTQKDFEQIKSLGCDVIRMPITFFSMGSGAPDYTFDPIFLGFLDDILDIAEATEMHLIIDNHSKDFTDFTPSQLQDVLTKVWTQIATHCKDRSAYIHYEVLNEPHDILDAVWNDIQQEVINTIRSVDTSHYIIVGASNWNSFRNLEELPVYDDDKLIYTFHFYDPFIFSHQGASWTGPSMENLRNVPFPYDPGRMPSLPAEFQGSWLEFAFGAYANEGTQAHVRQMLDIAIQFRDTRQVPVYCGEFGIFQPYSADGDRVLWYETVSEYLTEHDIAWTTWDYHGGFGLFEPGSNELFEHDLNTDLLEKLGLEVPEQTSFQMKGDSTGFYLYKDNLGEKVFESIYAPTGDLRLYDADLPQSGKYAIAWSSPGQYNAIGFDFRPDKDLSLLRNGAYKLDFWVRGVQPAMSFDVRFVDTKTSTQDHPWRMNYMMNASSISWDGSWQHFSIPLTQFAESGSWDNGQWFNPEGKFDWQAIDRFEIVTEYPVPFAAKLWFDEIQILNENAVSISSPLNSGFQLFPNPVQDILNVDTLTPKSYAWQIFDSKGAKKLEGQNQGSTQINMQDLPEGLYVFALEGDRGEKNYRIVIKQ